ncbi:putative NADH-dependent flavin oxidoreductase [Planococcus donghaensis MPA1U2]|uniref:Putative NADH-dependent flavin oxidoreductase n=1 Tax=Planococcus donghaensis MPA1U2 TaxID=933115 RepID=E7RC98_9BACL|nr:NADH:flavin oxidoreductase [Planococcus donghaensis]EGA91263.1 putative NADH-dependent flavin oxidoreductase [Planococcus donghaensis MPA1U2]
MTNNQFQTLFSELKIGNVTLDSRAALAPMTRTSATETGLATEDMAQYYANFAKGGFSLIITEGTYTDKLYSQGYFNQPGIATPDQTEAWKPVVQAVHKQGSKIFLQLMHAGALSQGNRFKEDTMAPSAVKPKGEQLAFYGGSGEFSMPKEMTKEDISQLITSFVSSAKNAKEAGFDGVEIHGANGYILDQFLTDYTNHRTDEYGGSTENRLRLIIEVIEAVRDTVGSDFPVGIRIAQAKVNDADYKWANGIDDAKLIFSRIGQAGVDYIHTSEPNATEAAFPESPSTLVELAKKYGNTVAIANGALENPQLVESLLSKGKADLVTIGKGALANQDWPNKILSGQELEVFDFQKTLLPKATLKEFEITQN